jgi:hypothetical protein
MNNTKYTKHLISSFTLASLLLFSSCGWPTANESGAKTITAVDGYIKDATVTDSSGQVAKYLGKNGKYKFAQKPTYPITLKGGALEDTDVAFDIEMTAESGSVVSPITTFINGSELIRKKLTSLGFQTITSNKGFAIDYINKNNQNLAKLSQLLYVMLRDENLADELKSILRGITGSNHRLNDLFKMAHSVMDKSLYTRNDKIANKELLISIQNFKGPVEDMEGFIEKKKKILVKDGNVSNNGGGTTKPPSKNGGGTTKPPSRRGGSTTKPPSGSGGSNTGDSGTINTPTVKVSVKAVVGGYVNGATVVDNAGQTATFKSNGKYEFNANPTYPITLSGGTLATGEELDIHMSVNDGKSLVISPITSFINNDSTLMSKLTNAGFTSINTMEGFGVDYIATNKKDLAKLSQLLYAMLRNNALTTKFKADIDSNEGSLDKLFDKANTVTDGTSSLLLIDKLRNKSFIKSIKEYTGTVANIETDSKIKAFKYNLNHGNDNITQNGISYGTVMSPATGKIWLDRNLGASKVCDKNRDGGEFGNDSEYVNDQKDCFGDYYQWGRGYDGHEKSNSATTDTKADSIAGAGSEFVKVGDWLADGVDNDGAIRASIWDKTDGTSICPVGYKVPIRKDLQDEADSLDDTSRSGAFNEFFKFPTNGRHHADGSLSGRGNKGNLWLGATSLNIYFDKDSFGFWGNDDRSTGYSVRCIKAD